MLTFSPLAPSDYRQTRWKNGGGATSEIAVYPAASGLDDFLWRVSVADIARDGPFSRFPGVERTIVLLSDDGMRLTGDGGALDLRTLHEPVTFSGDSALECILAGGPSRDFNLMVRSAAAKGEVVVVRGAAEALPPAHAYVCYAAEGTSECLIAGQPPVELAPAHALVMTRDHASPLPALHVYPTSASSVALVAVITLPSAAMDHASAP